MRPIATEKHAVGADDLSDLYWVVFPEWVDPHVLAEQLERILLEVARHATVVAAQFAHEVGQEL